MLTHEYLTSMLRYEPETGNFYWINPHATQKRWLGKIAGSTKCYPGMDVWAVKIMLQRKSYSAHRLAWFYVHGEWPKGMIDHINGDPLDNRIANLREATPRQNQFNKRVQKRNRLGVKGVKHSNTPGKFVSYIRIDGHQTYLGTFDTVGAAQAAYANAAIAAHGEFVRLD